MSLAQRMHILADVFQITAIVLVLVINQYCINGFHRFWDTLYKGSLPGEFVRAGVLLLERVAVWRIQQPQQTEGTRFWTSLAKKNPTKKQKKNKRVYNQYER